MGFLFARRRRPSFELALLFFVSFAAVRKNKAFFSATTTLSFRRHHHHRTTTTTTTTLALPPSDDPTPDARPNVVRIYTDDDDGHSHLERLDDLSMAPFTDKEGATGWASAFENCRGISFRTSAPGYALGWHCAPRRQYVIQLKGRLEVTCSDGNQFTAGPGDVLLAEDLTGRGHKTRVVGNETRVYAVVPLLENDDDDES